MLARKRIDEVAKPGAADAGPAVVKAAVSIPVLGPAAAEPIALVVTPPLEKRRNEWLNDLANDLDALQQAVDGCDVSTLDMQPMPVGGYGVFRTLHEPRGPQ